VTKGWHWMQDYHHSARWLEAAAGFLQQSSALIRSMRLEALSVLKQFTAKLLELGEEQPFPSKTTLQAIMQHSADSDSNLVVASQRHAQQSA